MSRRKLIQLALALCCVLFVNLSLAQTCGTCPDEPVELYLTADNLQPVMGDQICYTLRARNFDGVTTFAFTFTYSTQTLAISSYNALVSGLPGFDNPDVVPPTQRDPDIYRVLWADEESKPQCKADDTALLEMCFDVTGSTGQTVRVEIGANGFPGTGAYVQFARLDSTGVSCQGTDRGVVNYDDFRVPSVIGSTCDSGIEVVSFNRCGSLPGQSDGTVELQFFCGTGPYQVNVDASPAITTSDSVYLITGLRSGNHVIRVTDTGSGTSSSPFQVEVPTTPGLDFDFQVTQPRCAVSGSTPRGRIVIMDVVGGTPFAGGDYLFDWGADLFGKGDSVLSFLDPGTYDLRISDSLGCTITSSFNLATELIEVIPSGSPAQCLGVPNGSVSVTASGGIGPGLGYRFWLEGTSVDGETVRDVIQPNQSATATFTMLPAGNYQIWAEDDDVPSGSCDPNPQTVSVGLLQNYNAVISPDPGAGCDPGMRSLNIDITRSEQGANIAYQIFQVDNGTETLVVSDVANNPNLNISTGCQIFPLGNYELRLQDDDGCTYIESFFVDGCELVVDPIVSDPFCGSPGSISLFTFSGTEPIQYQWSTGETTSSIVDLPEGTYDVTIIDADQCSLLYSFDLVEEIAFTTMLDAPPITCPGSTTDITVTPSEDGFPPFVYDWSPNSGTVVNNQLTGVSAGTYVVTVTDDDGFGCQIVDSITITEVTGPGFALTDVVPPTCQGDNSGVIQISMQINADFPGPFEFEASSGAMGTAGLTFAPANLPSGDQWIVYRTLDGCEFDTVFFNVPEGPKLEIDTVLSSLGMIECFGDLAIVNLSVNGASNVSYQWPAPYDNGTGNTKVDVAAGTYIITLTSGTCTSEDTISIIQPDSFLIDIDQNLSSFPLCSDDLADLVSATVGGTMPFNYRWEDDGGNLISSDLDANGLQAGTYFVTATDDNGCTASTTVDVTVNEPVEAFISEPVQPRCFGDAGQIFVDSVRGGQGPYRYQIDTNPAVDIRDTATVQSGDHRISIFDLNGCSTSFDFTIDTPQEVSITLSGDTELELGRTGVLNSDVVSPVSIDSIIWSSNGNSGFNCLTSDCSDIEINPIDNDIFTATVINEDNCTAVSSINVSVIMSRRVYIPNVFNPASVISSRHQVFQVYTGSGVESIDFIRVFDRWGNMVYEELNPPVRDDGLGTGSWDGTLMRNGDTGRALEAGVYVYVLQIRYLGDPDPEIRKGDVTLIR